MFHADHSPKASATYVHNLTTILADAATFTPGALNWSIASKPATVHGLLMQKQGPAGDYYLALWDERLMPTSVTDTFTLSLAGGPYDVDVYDPTIGTTVQTSYAGISSHAFTLSDHPIILDISPGTTTPASTFSIAAPTAGAAISGPSVAWSGLAGATWVNTAVWFGGTKISNADAAPVCDANGSCPFSGTFDSTKLPNGTQTIRFTAYSVPAGQSGGTSVSVDVSVSVSNAGVATATLTASPPSINAGQSSTLAWTSSGTTASPPCVGTGFSAGSSASGSISVSPSTTTTYSITCTGNNIATASATVGE